MLKLIKAAGSAVFMLGFVLGVVGCAGGERTPGTLQPNTPPSFSGSPSSLSVRLEYSSASQDKGGSLLRLFAARASELYQVVFEIAGLSSEQVEEIATAPQLPQSALPFVGNAENGNLLLALTMTPQDLPVTVGANEPLLTVQVARASLEGEPVLVRADHRSRGELLAGAVPVLYRKYTRKGTVDDLSVRGPMSVRRWLRLYQEYPREGVALSTIDLNGDGRLDEQDYLLLGMPVAPQKRVAYSRTVGNQTALLVMVDFSDDPAGSSDPTSAQMNAKVFGQTGITFVTYWEEQARGKLSQTGEVASVPTTYGYLRVPAPYTKEWWRYTLSWEEYESVLDALDPYVDFSQFDGDGDGSVDHVFVAYVGEEEPNNLWPHTGQRNVSGTWDDTQVFTVTIQSVESGPFTYAHESGHEFGLPDLYDYFDVDLGDHDLMSSSKGDEYSLTYLSPWTAATLGIIEPTMVYTSGTYALPSYEASGRVLRIWTGWSGTWRGEEYFLVANFTGGFERALGPGAEGHTGFGVYHVDEYFYDNFGSPDLVDVEEADDDYDTYMSYDLWQPGGTFGPSTSPNTDTNTGVATGITMEFGADSVTVIFDAPAGLQPSFVSPTDGSTVSGTVQVRIESATGDFIEFYAGEALKAFGDAPLVVDWDTTSHPDGAITLSAIASTGSGGPGNEAMNAIEVTVRNDSRGLAVPFDDSFEYDVATWLSRWNLHDEYETHHVWWLWDGIASDGTGSLGFADMSGEPSSTSFDNDHLISPPLDVQDIGTLSVSYDLMRETDSYGFVFITTSASNDLGASWQVVDNQLDVALPADTWTTVSADLTPSLFPGVETLLLKIEAQSSDLGPYWGYETRGYFLDNIQMSATSGYRPRLTSAEPAEAARGAEVTLTGSYFLRDGYTSSLLLGANTIESGDIVSWTESEIRFIVPEWAPLGDTFLLVEVGAEQSDLLPFTVLEDLAFGISVGPEDRALLRSNALIIFDANGTLASVEIFENESAEPALSITEPPWELIIAVNGLPNRDIAYRFVANGRDGSSLELRRRYFMLTLQGDLNGDGRIDDADVEVLRPYVGLTSDDDAYSPIVDADLDGSIDERDASWLGYHYGETL